MISPVQDMIPLPLQEGNPEHNSFCTPKTVSKHHTLDLLARTMHLLLFLCLQQAFSLPFVHASASDLELVNLLGHQFDLLRELSGLFQVPLSTLLGENGQSRLDTVLSLGKSSSGCQTL